MTQQISQALQVEELPQAARRFQDATRRLGIDLPIRSFPDSTRTAAEAAAAVGVEVGQIVKSLVFIAGERPIIALLSGSNRLDTQRLSGLAGSPVRRADANQVRAATGYAIGGVPPFGFPSPLETYIDRDLLRYHVVWAAAGTPHHVFPIKPAELVRLSGASVEDLAQTTGG